MKACTIIFNAPKTGHIFAPIDCESIAAAEQLAKELAFPYRIFIDGKLYKRGWYA